MKLCQFKTNDSDRKRVGLLIGDDAVCDLAELARAVKSAGGAPADWLLEPKSMSTIINRGDTAVADIASLVDSGAPHSARGQTAGYSVDSIEFSPAVYPSKIMAIGRNYAEHAAEGGADLPKAPLLFNKLPNALSAHNAPIVLPRISEKVDYEAELAVVIGKPAKKVNEADALDHVFGYSLINDVSARDLQFGDGQWTRGKSLDTFAPLGPFITTRDEIDDVQSLNIEGVLNGQVMQSSNTSKMIFTVAYLISYLSQGITLQPGDVIATGTPDGVGVFRQPPVLLKAGDVFEVKIEKLGTLRNPVIAQD
ncbi:MAG TPA: fumarylacetoacetate hydrolase family protein [Pyrinomonadaceae bacterium]|jgi:2-keto-4-pentenoate hydratase/2-oxohepta-3-ene-1,7-dioic acid hydratase in catechol pathway|nr:fumarylacetoacetate hydrolase family protein [Pyrinomonadaceae bacterium]